MNSNKSIYDLATYSFFVIKNGNDGNMCLMDPYWFNIPAAKVGNYIISLKCFYMQIHLQISYMWACASRKRIIDDVSCLHLSADE